MMVGGDCLCPICGMGLIHEAHLSGHGHILHLILREVNVGRKYVSTNVLYLAKGCEGSIDGCVLFIAKLEHLSFVV